MGISGIDILASSACFLYWMYPSSVSTQAQLNHHSLPWKPAHVQPNAPDCANLLARQRRQDTPNDSSLSGRRPSVEDRIAAVDTNFDILPLAHGSANIDGRIDGLAEENLGLIALGHETDDTCTPTSQWSALPSLP